MRGRGGLWTVGTVVHSVCVGLMTRRTGADGRDEAAGGDERGERDVSKQ